MRRLSLLDKAEPIFSNRKENHARSGSVAVVSRSREHACLGSKDAAVLAGFCARFIHRVNLEARTMEEASWPGKTQDQFGSVPENPPGRIGADSVPST